MAKLKGGSYVAGQLTVEDAVVANAYLTDAGTMMVSVAAGSVPAANTIVKIGSAEGDLIASILTEVDSVLTITGDSVTLGASTVRTLKLADAGVIANPDLIIVSASSLSIDRMLTIDVVDANRTLQLAANLAIASGNVTINGTGAGSTLTLPEASISINSIDNGNVLYASAANTISGEASLSPTRGGTGLVAPAIFSILYGNSTDDMGLVTPNTEDTPKALLMTGTGTAGAAPIWSVIPNAALEYSYITINGTDVSLGEAIEIAGGGTAIPYTPASDDETYWPILWSSDVPGGAMPEPYEGDLASVGSCADVLIQSSTGTVQASVFDATSRRSAKSDISEYNGCALDVINGTKICTFYYNSDKEKKYLRTGFIADDTDEAIATVDHNTMDIGSSIGVLMKAVQELDAIVQKQAADIEKLKQPFWKRWFL